MATFASFMDSADNLSVSADERTYTITGDWNWDGALDDNCFPRGEDGITIVLSGSSAKLRCSAGASGIMGGYSQPIRIIENGDAHAYPNDNGNPASPTDCRFVGVGTSIWDNIIWVVKPRSSGNARSDFDVGRNFSGTFRGFRLIQEWTTGQSTPFNHIYTSNLKLEIDENGLGYSIRNERNAHAMIIEANPNAQFEGLASDDVDIPVNTRNEGSTKGSSARIVVNIPANTTFTLVGLDTATLTQSSNNSTSICKLVNPKQIPTLTNNWNSPAGATTIIERDQLFNFSGAIATGTLYADSQAASNGDDATAEIPANGQIAVRCRTHYSAYTGNSSGGSWTDTDSYKFQAVGYGFRKWQSDDSTSIGTNPSVMNETLVADILPDGTEITAFSTGAASTAGELYRALKTYEGVNRSIPSHDEPLAIINSLDNLEISSEASLRLSDSQTPTVAREGSTITVRVPDTKLQAGNSINSLDTGADELPSSTTSLLAIPYKDDVSGASSVVRVSAHANEVVGIFKDDGTKLGKGGFSSDGSYSFLINASDSAANTRVGVARAGYEGRGKVLDLSAGGTHSLEFDRLIPVPGPDGATALYDNSANAAGRVEGVIQKTSTDPVVPTGHKAKKPGDCVLKISTGNASPADVFKAYHDAVAASDGEGCRVPAFGRRYLYAVDITGQPGNLFLGPDCILSRDDDNSNGAFFLGYPFGGIGGDTVDGPASEFISYTISVGSCNLNLINENITEVKTKVAEVKADTETVQEQNEHLATSLPLTLHEPLSPQVIVTGLEGQEIIRDTEETQWSLTTSGTAGNGDPEAHGVVTFNGNNSHIDYSLNRSTDPNNPDLYTSEIIVLCQIYPTSFPASGQRPFGNIGALTLSINNSTGNTAALHFGAGVGATTTTNQVNLNQWNDLVFVFTQNPDRPNNPRIRVSINGSAQETGNLGAKSTLGNDIFGPIASNTQNFRIGGHGTGSQTSGFQGRARAIFVHPDNEVFGTDGWDIPTGVYWNSANQLWQGAQLMDRVEGIAVDRIERTIDNIDEKTFTLEEQANAVLRQPFSAGINAGKGSTDSLTQYLKWLATNVNTTEPDSKADIAAEIGARTIPNSPTAGTYDAAMANAEDANTTTPPTASAIATAVENELTIPTPPSAATIATAVENELDIPTAAENATATWSANTSSNNTDGSMGHRLQETSTHDAPADAPVATDIAKAVWDYLTTNTLVGSSFGEKLNNLTNNEITAADIVTAIMQNQIEGGKTFQCVIQAMAAALGGRAHVDGDTVTFYAIGTADSEGGAGLDGIPTRLTVRLGSPAGERLSSTIPSHQNNNNEGGGIQ